MPFSNWFARHADYGALFIRLITAAILIEGTADNVFSSARMHEFSQFLGAKGVPFPMFGAVLSAYAQFICGFLILFGAATRLAGAIMAVNFVAAVLIAHTDAWQPARLALLMLGASLFLLFHGAGRPSVDAWLTARRHSRPSFAAIP